MTMMLPPLPLNVRLATPADLPRLGIVAVAGYYNAEIFSFRRPHFSEYPGDTVDNYTAGYRGEFLNARSAVFVVEDELRLDEVDQVCDELKPLWPKYGKEDAGRKVIVAASSVAVPEECEWAKARVDEVKHIDIPAGQLLRRDEDPRGREIDGAIVGPVMMKHINSETAEVHTFVLHPAYGGRRHGDTLIQYVQAFFASQGVGYFLAATAGGKKLYLRNGGKDEGTDVVPGYDAHPEPIDVHFVSWKPPAEAQ